MAGKARYSRAMIKKAILGDPDVLVKGADGKTQKQSSSMGVKATICARLNCSRQTLDNYLAKYEDLAALVEAESENIIDVAENKLLGALNKGDMRAILFVLETKGKRRGWSKRTEITGAEGVPLGLSAEVVAQMRLLGINESDLVREFTAMIQAEAAKLNG